MKIGGKEYGLRFSAEALFLAMEKYGSENPVEEIGKPGKEGFDALCWMAAELSRQHELYRRYQGETPEEYLTEQAARAEIMPRDLLRVRSEVVDAIFAGLYREEEQEKEVDLGLAELQKKTGES